MLIGKESPPFDSGDYLYELKFDGVRSIAYLDPATDTVDLRNKRGLAQLPHVPELGEIYRAARTRCILDGELFILENGKPSFERIESRVMTTNRLKLDMAASQHPASYVAFDILFRDDRELVDLPLQDRKEILRASIVESPHIAISRVFEYSGVELFHLAAEQNLEGIVAKLKTGRYHYGKHTKQWIKSKVYVDEDFLPAVI